MAMMDPNNPGDQIPSNPSIPPAQSADFSKEQVGLQKIRDLFGAIIPGATDAARKMAEAQSAQEAFADSLSKKKKAAVAAELADLDAVAKAKMASLSKTQKEELDFEKTIAVLRHGAEVELSRATDKQREAIENLYVAAETGLRNAREQTIQESSLNAAHTEALRINEAMPSKVSIFDKLGEMYSKLSSTTLFSQGLTLTPAITQAQAALRGAGVSGGAGLLGGTNPLTGGTLAGLLSPTEEQQAIKLLAETAPRAFGNSAESVKQMIGVLGYFGSSVNESTKILADASYKENLSSTDLTNSFLYASSATSKLGLSAKQGSQLLIDMTASLRGSGHGIEVAAGILDKFDSKIKFLGMTMSGAEVEQFTKNIASALGNLSPATTAALVSFTKNLQGLPSPEQLKAVDPLKLAGDFFKKTAGMFPQGSTERLLATGPVAEMLGFGRMNVAQQSKLAELLNQNNLSSKSLEDLIKLNPLSAEAISKSGFDTLKDSLSPLVQIQNNTAGILQNVSVIAGNTMQSTAGQIVGGGANLAKEGLTLMALARLSGMSGFVSTAAEGGLLAASAAALGPIGATAAAVGAVGWAGYEARKAGWF